jgi:FlaG/FlaF family flagellin (archaellin)
MNAQPDYSRFVPPPQQSSSRTWLYVLIGVIVACLCCVMIAVVVALAGGAGAFGLVTGLISESQSLAAPVDGYMHAMSNNDAETARTYFAAGAGVSSARLKEQLTGANFALYDQYESTSVTHFSINTNTTGTLAEISGTIRYSDGSTGTFDATLKKDGDVWKLNRMPIIDVQP